MKKTYILGALALTALSIAPQSFGQTVIPGSVSKVTFKFNLSATGDLPAEFAGVVGTLKGKDAAGELVNPKTTVRSNTYTVVDGDTSTTTLEIGEKFVARRFGNKEFLQQLTEETGEGLPLITDIKGWSIVKVQSTSGTLPELSISGDDYFLVKKGVAPISLAGYIITDSAEDYTISAAKAKIVTETVTAGEPPVATVSSTGTYSELYKMFGDVTLNLDGQVFNMSGVLSGGQKLGKLKGSSTPNVLLSTATKLTSLAGTGVDNNFGEPVIVGIVEGSATMSAGVATDVASYYPVEEEEEVVE
ncbi:hypothetical protein [Prosthecobacter sp. SYSU 5D2]|uniref:hypothetical protein n=1 Tax=Prosthecobacter sp. SYSU 5D2 TaxID=3134134 RepID=UPI0031FEBB1E